MLLVVVPLFGREKVTLLGNCFPHEQLSRERRRTVGSVNEGGVNLEQCVLGGMHAFKTQKEMGHQASVGLFVENLWEQGKNERAVF